MSQTFLIYNDSNRHILMQIFRERPPGWTALRIEAVLPLRMELQPLIAAGIGKTRACW